MGLVVSASGVQAMLSTHELRRHPCLAGAGMDLKVVLEMASDVLSVEDGELIFAAGDDADNLYIICSGRVELVTHLGDGRPAVLETLIAGDLLGVSAMLPRGRRRLSATARGPVEAIAIDGRLLRYGCDDNPWLGRSMLMSVVETMDRRAAAHNTLLNTLARF